MDSRKPSRTMVLTGKQRNAIALGQRIRASGTPEEKRKLQLRVFWERVAHYANRTLPTKQDVQNMIALGNLLRWETKAARTVNRMRKDRDDIRKILLWLAAPGRDHETDKEAVRIVERHARCGRPKLKLLSAGDLRVPGVSGGLVERTYSAPHFVDPFARIAISILGEVGTTNLARIPPEGPLRVCDKPGCEKLFRRDGKITCCISHRGRAWRLPREIHRKRKWVWDKIKDPDVVMGRLRPALDGRLRKSRDAEWKEVTAKKIAEDYKNKSLRSPSDYVPYKEE